MSFYVERLYTTGTYLPLILPGNTLCFARWAWFCQHIILIVDGAVQNIKQYAAITAYGFTLAAEAVG